MDFTLENILSITFWKRNPNSVESVYRLTLTPVQDGFQAVIESETKTERLISNNEISSLLKSLTEDCHIQETEDAYRAFLYEDNKADFSIKFFLTIENKDYEYIAVKGIHPFKQPYYKEILALFNPLF